MSGRLSFWINDYLQYRIQFQHLTPNQVDKKVRDKRKPRTTCLIQMRDSGKGEKDWTTLSSGTVRLFNGDSWNRTLGRQYAFEAAMRILGNDCDRATRTALWKHFWNTCCQNAKLKQIREKKDA